MGEQASRGSGASGSPDPFETGLARVLPVLRRERGYSRRDLAAHAELSPSYIAKIEAGKRRSPSEPALASLATALGLPVSELVALATEWGTSSGDDTDELAAEPRAHLLAVEDAAPPGQSARAHRRPASAAWSPRLTNRRGDLDEIDRRLAPTYGMLRSLAERDDELADLAERVIHHLVLAPQTPDARQELERLVETAVRTSRDLPTDVVARVLRTTASLVARHGDDHDADGIDQLLETISRALLDPDAGGRVDARQLTTVPANVDYYILARAVRRDEQGHLWLSPTAAVHRPGLAGHDPGVRRLDDGRVLLDAAGIDTTDLRPRDPDRHTLKPLLTRSLQPVPSGEYEATILEIDWPAHPPAATDITIRVEPRSRGETDGEFPSSVTSIHVVTAHNPAPDILTPEENAQRNERLLADVARAGHRWHHAAGVSPNPHVPWREDGYALIDTARQTALDLARAYNQRAIFEWTREHRAVLRCDTSTDDLDETVHPHGWHATWNQRDAHN